MSWIKAILLSVCALTTSARLADVASPPVMALPPEIDALVTENLDRSDYVQTTTCIGRAAVRDIVVLSNQYLLFVGGDDRLWLNRLKSRCVGLRRNAQLELANKSLRFCRSGEVVARRFGRAEHRRAFESFGRKTPEEIIGTKCVLGEFESVDVQQAMALRAQFQPR